jgi:hypothetical protein
MNYQRLQDIEGKYYDTLCKDIDLNGPTDFTKKSSENRLTDSIRHYIINPVIQSFIIISKIRFSLLAVISPY